MSEEHGAVAFVDVAFLTSKRGILKAAEMVALFVAFVCFTVVSRSKDITATVLELLVSSLLLGLYLFRLNKRFTFFFWPLVDVFNSLFAVVYLVVLSLLALTTDTVTGTLVGGVFTLASAALLGVDGFLLFRNITFNKPRGEARSPSAE